MLPATDLCRYCSAVRELYVYMCMYDKACFFAHGPAFLFWPRVILALSAAMQVLVPVGLRGACSGRSKSRDLASTQRIAFRLAEPRGTMEPHMLIVWPFALLLRLYRVVITSSLKLLSCLLCGSHGTAAVAHETLPFVTATDGASVCVRACLCHVCFLSTSGIVNTSK